MSEGWVGRQVQQRTGIGKKPLCLLRGQLGYVRYDCRQLSDDRLAGCDLARLRRSLGVLGSDFESWDESVKLDAFVLGTVEGAIRGLCEILVVMSAVERYCWAFKNGSD